jgi:hypothetical protein
LGGAVRVIGAMCGASCAVQASSLGQATPARPAAGGTDLPSAPGPWLITKPKHQDGDLKVRIRS